MNQYYIIQPAQFKLDGGAMYGIIPKPLWNRNSPADEQNRIELALRLMVIKQPKRVILIDTGIGDYHPDKFNSMFDIQGEQNPLSNALETIGIYPADVTDIIISHLHFDHVGGLGIEVGAQQTPIFPHATLHLHKDHFAYAQSPTDRDRGSFHLETFMPLIEHYRDNNLIEWLEGSQGAIFKDNSLHFKTSKGHTPFMIHPYDDKFIYMADIVPTSNHIKDAWVMGYDMAPGVSVQNKKEILEFAHSKNLSLIFEHDPVYWGASIDKNEKGKIVIKEPFTTKTQLAQLLNL